MTNHLTHMTHLGIGIGAALATAKPTKLERRPAEANYADNLRLRFGPIGHLCELSALVSLSGDTRKPYAVEEGVAIIEISGVLTNDPWWWDESGYAQIQSEVEQAAGDADVKSILLAINSPGGETTNAFETATAIAAAAKRKRMWAVADPMAYSAGYLLASQAELLYMGPVTGGVGSIGIVAQHFDYSKFLEQAGIVVTQISAGKGKTDGSPFEPLSDSARKAIAAEVDRLYVEFVGAVSRGRGLTPEAIRALGARLYHGYPAAKAVGLADRAGRRDEAIAELAAAAATKVFSIPAASAAVNRAKETNMSEATKPADATAAAAAAPVDQEKAIREARAAGFADALEIAELCNLAGAPERTLGYLRERKPVAEVRQALSEKRAERSAAAGEIDNKTLPGTGTKVPKGESLGDRMKARLAAQNGGK